MVGTEINHYKILSKLGSGGMGEVYVAEDTKLNRRIALKILPPELAEKPERRERFEREAQAVAALNHPNIVTIHSVEESSGVEGHEGSVHFLTMELVEGQTLDEAIPQKGFSLDRFFEVAVPVVDAISAAHDKGITHRDLKPSNIMITKDGRVKVLDFGLARFDDGPLETAATQASERLTGEGQILGTTAYMSPEQAEGKPADHRSDIFSLGIIFYEMATGERPFKGDTQISMITSILRDEPTSITDVRRTYPRHLARIISHSLEKDPQRRYHSSIDLRNDLESLQEEIDSGESPASGLSHAELAAAQRAGARSWLAYAAVVILAAIAASVWGYRQLWGGAGGESAPSRAIAADARPSLAVLYFDNVSGEEKLDWLRTGLTELMVTDLSQSPDLRVLGTDRVYEILSEIGETGSEVTSSAMVRAVAEEAHVENVVLGSYMQAGDTIRITARLQDAASGEVLASEQVEGTGESSIFSMVDDLTLRLRSNLSLAPSTDEDFDRGIGQVTTDSIAAYRYFAEANRYHAMGNVLAALPLFERAVEIDPNFALALAKLSITYSNIYDLNRALAYGERALEHVDRLTLRERLYIEGAYYSIRRSTAPQSIRAYERVVELYPDLTAARNNLAAAYLGQGRYEEALALLEPLAQARDSFQGVYGNLGNAYGYLGQLDRARDAFELLVEYFPEVGASHRNMGLFLARVGDFETAGRMFDRAATLSPADPLLIGSLSEMRIMTGDYAGAAEAAAGLLGLPIPSAQAWGTLLGCSALLHEGDLSAALTAYERLAEESPSGILRAMGAVELARLALDQHDPERALAFADAAAQDAEGLDFETIARSLESRALLMLGREEEARSKMVELVAEINELPNDKAARVERHLYPGQLAQEDGRVGAAVDELLQAEGQLTVYSDLFGPDFSFHSLVWYSLGLALMESGDEDAAIERFTSLEERFAERSMRPVEYVRSLYFLGKIHAERGDAEQAGEYLQRFLDHWGDGEIDRNRVAEARELLASL